MADEKESHSPGINLITGGVVTGLVFIAGLFLKEQNDVAAIQQRQKDHDDFDASQFSQIQTQLDRRITAMDYAQRDRGQEISKDRDIIIANETAIAENKAQILAAVSQVASLSIAFDRGRQERLAADEALGKRIDEMTFRLNEVQRQTSALEGKLDVPGVPTKQKR